MPGCLGRSLEEQVRPSLWGQEVLQGPPGHPAWPRPHWGPGPRLGLPSPQLPLLSSRSLWYRQLQTPSPRGPVALLPCWTEVRSQAFSHPLWATSALTTLTHRHTTHATQACTTRTGTHTTHRHARRRTHHTGMTTRMHHTHTTRTGTARRTPHAPAHQHAHTTHTDARTHSAYLSAPLALGLTLHLLQDFICEEIFI